DGEAPTAFGELVPQPAVFHDLTEHAFVFAVLCFQSAGSGRDARVPGGDSLVFAVSRLGFSPDGFEPHGFRTYARVAELLADMGRCPAGVGAVAVPHMD